MACSKRILASAVLVLMAMKSIPTVTSRRTKIILKTKVNFDFDSSKPMFSKYYGTYDCEDEHDCQGDYDTTTTEPIKNKQPMWKINSKTASGEYEITQTIISFSKNEKSFDLPQVTGHILSILKAVEIFWTN